MPPEESAPTAGLPAWLSTLGNGIAGVGKFGLNTLAVVGGVPPPFPGQPFDFMSGAHPGGWQHPERQALAQSYIPDGLTDADKARRMETFRLVPINNWPMLIRQFQKTDLEASKLWASPEAQRVYDQGGPDAWERRYPGVPLPASKPITVKDYPPMDELDQAIARMGNTSSVPLPFPVQAQSGPVFPSVGVKDAIDDATNLTQWGAMTRPGAEGAMARSAVAKVPLGFEDATAAAQQFGQIAQRLGYLPEISVDSSGVSLKMSRPGQQAFESGMGAKRSNVTPLGGGGGAAPTAPAAKPGGNTGVDTADGRWFDLGNGQYADPQGNIHDQLPTGTPTRPATVEPAAPTEPPMRGQVTAPPVSLSIENFPNATAADFEGMAADQRSRTALALKEQELELTQRFKDRNLTEDERTQLRKIAAARAIVQTFEDYALHGSTKDTSLPATERVPSALPKKAITGMGAAGEAIRQSETYQKFDRNLHLKALKGLRVASRSLLIKSLGDDSGNVGQQEGQQIDALTDGMSQPEIRQQAGVMRKLLDEREASVLKGKADRNGGASAPASGGTTRTMTLRNGKTVIVTE